MQAYIQLNKDNYITDCITYKYSDYLEVDLDLPLPDKFISGCYKYLGDNKFELDPTKVAAQEPTRLDHLEADMLYLSIMTGVDL